jgi:hypothetical protein
MAVHRHTGMLITSFRVLLASRQLLLKETTGNLWLS